MPSNGTQPHWDAATRELVWDGVLIKKFCVPASNQETILAVFEEEGWPEIVADPLPVVPGLDPKQRLHNAIRNLNRNQRRRLLKFGGDRTGERIRWSYACPLPLIGIADS